MLADQLRTRIAVLSLAAAVAAVLACGGAGPASSDELASQSAAVTGGPDLVIQSVLGPPSSTSGAGPLTVTVTMCNNGDQTAYAPAGIYLTPETADGGTDGGAGTVQIGQTPYQQVMPGTCVITSASCVASVPNGIYVLSARADPTNAVPEVIESNNSKNGNRMGVGNKPDFTTDQVSGPTSATGGSPIAVSTLLCNQGTQPGTAPVDIYFSTDTNITTSDTLVGSLPGGQPLQPGTCAPLSGTVWATAPNGAYYLGAYADRPNFTVELIENNNTSASSARIGVGSGPDLTVASVSAGAGATTGGPLTVTAVVCNQGTAVAGAPVDIYLSLDANITTADNWLGSLSSPPPPLNPGTCAAVTGTVPASVPNGTYYVGAIVDRNNSVPELLENNNALAGNRVGVGNGPDLVVSSVTSAPSALAGSLAVSVTLCNQGTQPASAPVEVYLSSDPVVTAADFMITSLTPPPGPPLNPGGCVTMTGIGNAWVPNGPYYVGAIADRPNSIPETIEDNNTAVGNMVGIGNGPDLVVTSLTAAPSMSSGGSTPVTAVVCNQGTQSGGAPVDLYFSMDGTVTAADYLAGSLPGPNLAPGACATLTGSAYAPYPDGVWVLGAIVDRSSWLTELIETNNTTVGPKVGVGNKPDLVVTSVSGPPSATGGGQMTITATVCNQGTQMGNAQVDLYLSMDATVSASDWWIGSLPPGPSLSPGACATLTGPAPASVPYGIYSLGAIVDQTNAVAELREDNNTAVGGRVGVGNGPDLVVTSVTAPPSALPWSNVLVSATVCNQGTQGGSAPVDFFFSTDAVITGSDPWANTLSSTPWLNPGACATVSGNVPVVVPDGTYFPGAIVDRNNGVVELIEDNNATAGSPMGVGNKPDFVVTQVSTTPSAPAGSQVQVVVTICNQGTSAGTPSVDLFFSQDATITLTDLWVGSVSPGQPLNPGQCIPQTVPAWVPGPDGPFYVGAIADRNNQVSELREDNNALAGNLVVVGNKPDFVITQVSTVPSALSGSQVQVTVTYCNQGTTGGGPPPQVDLYFSQDTTITDMDYPGGFVPQSPSLNPGQCATQTVSAWPPPDGVYYAGAIVDRNNSVPELREDNNTFAGTRLAVGNRPDLVVTQVSTAPSATSGSQVVVNVTVCNQGTQAGSATVDLFFSSDTTITTADFWSNSLPGAPVLQPGACTTLTGPAWVPGPDGQLYVGAIADKYNSVQELREDNNATAGNRVAVGYGPDFVITQVSTTPSALPGSPLTVTLTLCNQGTTSGYAPVDLFFSQDPLITSGDFFAGSLASGPSLSPGACITQYAYVTAPWQNGVYYAGAVADRYGSYPELLEDNNAFAGTLVGVGSAPDLVVTQVSTPPTLSPGMPLAVTATVCNQGTAGGSGQVDVLLSMDASVGLEDPVAGPLPPTPNLSPGACATVSGSVWPSVPPGIYWVGAMVDRPNATAELREDNNIRAGGRLGYDNGPDLVVSSVAGPSSAPAWSTIWVTVMVCNQGNSTAYPGNVDVYVSPDATITKTDPWVGSLPSPGSLPAGACVSVNGPVPAAAPPGSYVLGAIVDGNNSVVEIFEDNNATAGGNIFLY